MPAAFLEGEPEADDLSSLSASPTSQVGAVNAYGQFELGAGPEDLVLAVVSKQRRLSAGIFAVQNNGRYYLPVVSLSQIFGFYHDFDISARFVEGWGISQDEKYVIDAAKGTLRFRGKQVALPSDSILDSSIADDDLYVAIEVLNQIWPMQMSVNLSGLVLRVIPDGKLPFEIADERKMARDRSLLQRENRLRKESEEDYPLIPYPYQSWSKPSVDLAGTFGFRPETEDPIASVSVSGVQDLFYASADYSVMANQVGGRFIKPENFRFRLRRQNIHEGALPFGLEDTQLGDVNLRNRDLISSSANGRGFVFTTEDSDRTGEFDAVTIDGTGVPGWEIELYLNNELIEFGEIDDTGEYRFEDVSIGFGNNRFRVVLYGPQGQIRERVENYLYQSSMVKAGKNVFSGGIVDQGKRLFTIDERPNSFREGLTANVYAARGLTNQITAFTSLNRTPDRDVGRNTSRDYATIGGIGALGNTIAQAELYKDLAGGEAVDIRSLSNFYGFKVNSQTSFFNDFESPDAGAGSNAKVLEAEIGIRKIFSTLIGSLGVEIRRNFLRREEGDNNTRYTTRQSLGFNGVRLTNTTRTDLAGTDTNHTSTTGIFSTSSRYNRWNLRNSLGYAAFPDWEAQNFQTQLRYGRQRELKTAISAGYNFLNDEKRLGLQLTKDFQKYLGSIETNWSSNAGIGFLARLSTALGPYGKNDDYLFRSQPFLNTGVAQAFVYNDRDYDGSFTEGDEPVEGARLVFGRRGTREKTDQGGILNEYVNYSGNLLNATVLDSSVDNPYLIAEESGYKIFPRAGVKQRLEFPLIETGAIDGTLSWSNDGKPIAGVALQILNDAGEVIQNTQTAVDGYYTFEQIPPGSYTIRPDPETGLDIPFKYVDITPDNLFQFGTDINSEGAEIDTALEQVNLGTTKVSNDGTLNVKNIIDIAKGYKAKSFQKASVSSYTQQPAKFQNASLGGNSRSVVKAVRIGDHPDKLRLVMDLSAPIQYEINFDPQSNQIFVNIPYVEWGAKDNWISKTGNILNDYRVEKTSNGVQLVMTVAEDVSVGASGLLKASAGRDDRLFIDIEKR